ncbi:MAG: alpha-ketoglutarate-dependent dioxygenase AlkB [Pseudomonadota bacterium]
MKNQDTWLPPTDIELDLPDADISLRPSFLSAAAADELHAALLGEISWEQRDIQLFGRSFRQPRLIAWHGDPGADYTYSGSRFEPSPWNERLRSVRDAVADAAGTPFNSVLLNLYRNERDSMGMHADDEPELGETPVIGSLSLGAERVLTLRHRSRRDLPTRRLPLPHGSLLIMRGQTQRHWKHGINKRTRPCGPRINLTFRHILR